MKISMFKRVSCRFFCVTALCFLSFVSCKKEKLDVINDNRPVTETGQIQILELLIYLTLIRLLLMATA